MLTQATATPKLFIGIDIHKKQWSVHLRTDIFDYRGFPMPPNPENPIVEVLVRNCVRVLQIN